MTIMSADAVLFNKFVLTKASMQERFHSSKPVGLERCKLTKHDYQRRWRLPLDIPCTDEVSQGSIA